MKKTAAVKYYGSETEIARVLKISQQAVNNWGRIIPIKQAGKLEIHSKGKLDFALSDYR